MKHKEDIDNKLDKIISRRFSASFMSNAKWIKLIKTLIEHHTVINYCALKLVYDDKIRQLIITGDEQYNLDFYSDSMEGMVSNPVVPGWTKYREIEWISFPKQFIADKNAKNQDLDAIVDIITAVGEFNIEKTKDYYRIYAYR